MYLPGLALKFSSTAIAWELRDYIFHQLRSYHMLQGWSHLKTKLLDNNLQTKKKQTYHLPGKDSYLCWLMHCWPCVKFSSIATAWELRTCIFHQLLCSKVTFGNQTAWQKIYKVKFKIYHYQERKNSPPCQDLHGQMVFIDQKDLITIQHSDWGEGVKGRREGEGERER